MRNSNYVVFDTETGGLDPLKNALLEVSFFLVDSKNFKVLDKLDFLVKPYDSLTVTKGALDANGISMAEVEADGLEKKEAYKRIVAFLKKGNNGKSAFTRPILVAHNTPFDLGFMDALFSGFNDSIFNYCTKQYICTQLETKKLEVLPNLKLKTCCEYFGIDLINAHRASGDVAATVKLLEALITRMRNVSLKPSKESQKEKEKSRTKFQF